MRKTLLILALSGAVALQAQTAEGNYAPATFEGLIAAGETYYAGDPEGGYSDITSGGFSFTNFFYDMETYTYWGGFGISESTSTAFDAANYVTDQFNSVPGGAYQGTGFAVAYSGIVPYINKTEITILANEDGAYLDGCYITNNMYLYSSVTQGDGYSDPFSEGDYAELTFTGDNGNTVVFPVADYRSADPADHYVLTAWTFCDLKPLGKVKTVSITMTASNDFVPGYFCMDNLTYAADQTGIENISSDPASDSAAPAEYYDLSGRRVANPSAGLFIERRGTTVRKVLLP